MLLLETISHLCYSLLESNSLNWQTPMVKTNSSLDNLRKGRGKKKKLGHKSYSIKLSPEDKKNVEGIAESFGCVYGNSGSISALLTKLATQELMVVATPPSWILQPSSQSPIHPDIEVLPDPEEVLNAGFLPLTTHPSAADDENKDSPYMSDRH